VVSLSQKFMQGGEGISLAKRSRRVTVLEARSSLVLISYLRAWGRALQNSPKVLTRSTSMRKLKGDNLLKLNPVLTYRVADMAKL
jgi:hypothetical protein